MLSHRPLAGRQAGRHWLSGVSSPPPPTHLPRSSRMAFRLLLLMGVSVLPNRPCRWHGQAAAGTGSGGVGR